MPEPSSTKPYLLRAMHEWCVDNGFTPYVLLKVDANTRVPLQFVREGEIVLNIGQMATHRLRIGNDTLEFAARFGGVAHEIVVPMSAIRQVYARENGRGMVFAEEDDQVPPSTQALDPTPATDGKPTNSPGRPGGRPTLTRVK